MMLKLIGLDHIVLRTSDIDAMLHFYCDVLGCRVERELSREIGLIQLRAGHSLIDIVPIDSQLGRQGGGPPRQEGRNLEHFCLTIPDEGEEKLLNYLSSHGIHPAAPEIRYGAGGFGKSVYINDPEDNIVELKLESISQS